MYLTSRAIPVRFNVFTTASTPLASSNILSALGESTRMQRSVSRIPEAKVGPEGPVELESLFGTVGVGGAVVLEGE